MNRNVKMCDLIDLNSPDRKGLLSTRLASPLIPAPTDTSNGNYNNRISEPCTSITGKRDSLDNNPFDMVLHKTTEYIQKKDDPFEVILEKALKPKCKKKNTFKTCSVDVTSRNILKRKESNQTWNMNRSLDESLINEVLNKKNLPIDKSPSESINIDLNNTNLLSDHIKSDTIDLSSIKDNHKIPDINFQDANLSILNQSVMNDALVEMNTELIKDQLQQSSEHQVTLCVQQVKNNIDHIADPMSFLKPPKLRRSFSQGAAVSPRKVQQLNQILLGESEKTGSASASSVSSITSLDVLNEGFIRSYYGSGSSIFSSLSNISSITKLNSVSSTINSSIMLSNGTINRTFLESCSSEKSDIKNTSFTLPVSESQTVNVLNKTQFSLPDLTDRFNKLKAQGSDNFPDNSLNEKNDITSNVSNDNRCATIMERKMDDINDKLIDIDVFTPEMNCNKEESKSITDISSDSVFLEENKINRSILQEAKLLAKTFEELALRTSSGSSNDDLLSNNPLWTSELLPAFDEDSMVDNLIELPSSPYVNETSKQEKLTEGTDNDLDKNGNRDSKVEENIKDLEMQLIEPIPTEKRVTATTLLLELRKLLKTENNVEASKLLENLEKVLGVNCESNIELLTTYLNTTNNLAKSPRKSSTTSEIIKNVLEINMEHSQEDNVISDKPENIKESAFYANMSNCVTDNEKCLKQINDELENDIPDVSSNNGKISKESEKDNSTQDVCQKDTPSEMENSNLQHEKIAVDLLTNLGKLLSGETKEHSTLDLLRNLGKVLNFASSNHNREKEAKTNNSSVEIQQTPKKSKLKNRCKKDSSVLSKSVNRYSLDIESKKQPSSNNFIRRSISVSQTPPTRGSPSPLLYKGKSTSQLKEATKRFPSDPGFISSTVNKKMITNNNKTDVGKDVRVKTVTTLDAQKEKTTMISTVKNKLKNKVNIDTINRKGPMKAVLPIGSMQKKENINKKRIPPIETITPPKSHKIISSTPNSSNKDSVVKNSLRSSKPVASSTPDAHNSKTRKVELQISDSSKKRNFSCDISPVTTRKSGSYSSVANNSPKRNSKLPSPKRTTPKRASMESNIPKSRTPPVHKRLNSSFDLNRYENRSTESQKNSPISMKKNGNNMHQSPLKDSNKLIYKAKPVNLISKLRRNSIGTIAMEKENNYI